MNLQDERHANRNGEDGTSEGFCACRNRVISKILIKPKVISYPVKQYNFVTVMYFRQIL